MTGVQTCALPILLPQFVASLNRFTPAPLIAIEVRLSVCVPLLATTTAWPVVTLPATMVGKVIDGTMGVPPVPGARLRPTGVSAVPVKAVAAGLTAAPLLFTFNDAVNVPAVLDVKVTVIVQCAPTARGVVQLLVWVKSLWLVPLIDTLGVFMVAVPVFVKVAVCGWPVDNRSERAHV